MFYGILISDPVIAARGAFSALRAVILLFGVIVFMDLIKELNGDLTDYTSMPFWSWNNKLEIPELLRQIHEFKERGIDAFIMHARTGLRTDYLGEEWFNCIGACLEEADKLNMQAWVYDENGWPSGFVGGELLKEKENLVQQFFYQVKPVFDREAFAVYTVTDGHAVRIAAPTDAEEYHCVYIKDNDSYADILNTAVADKFISATHEQYFKHFEKYFGKSLKGFFTDEPQYFRHGFPYSRILPSEFEKEYGENIADGLIYMFIGSPESKKFRYRYYLLLNKLYTAFYKKLYDWCSAHNCMLTGHTVEEPRLSTQLWCCAGAMPSYEYEHIPGIDWLGRELDVVHSPKQAGSAAQQLGKKFVLTETFGCSGWDTTPRELRRVAEFQYVLGVNKMCQHLVSYSLRGQAKGDYPPSFSRHNLWIKDSKPFNDYFKRLSFILSNTKECADVLVVHPMHDAYMTYKRDEDFSSIADKEKTFEILSAALVRRGVQFHYGDECIMARHAQVRGNKFFVGNCVYGYIVIPEIESIDSSTLKLIEEFKSNGGKVCLFGKSPAVADGFKPIAPITGNFDFDNLPHVEFRSDSSSNLIFAHRKGEIGEFLYIVNTDAKKEAVVSLPYSFEVVNFIDCKIEKGVNSFIIPAKSSVMLRLCESAVGKRNNAVRVQDITEKFAFKSASDNCLTVDFVSISYDGKNFSKPQFVHAVNEQLIKEEFKGKIWVKYNFVVKDAIPKVRVLMEKLNYYYVSINGADIRLLQSEFDVFFRCADISSYLKKGENEIVACVDYYQGPAVKHVLCDPGVMESLKNCLVIDTEIETLYLYGNFIVNEDREIVMSDGKCGLSNIQEQGYPNFAGKITFEAELFVENVNKQITVSGRYMVAEITVNGRAAAKLVVSESADISAYLQKGKNKLEITLTSSMRNMLGPLHFKHTAEPTDYVGHQHFEFRGTWENGVSPDFTPEYRTMPFGVDKIILSDIL